VIEKKQTNRINRICLFEASFKQNLFKYIQYMDIFQQPSMKILFTKRLRQTTDSVEGWCGNRRDNQYYDKLHLGPSTSGHIALPARCWSKYLKAPGQGRVE